MSLGINGITAFLSSKSVNASTGQLKPGQPVECIVENISEASRTVTLRAQKKAVQEAVVFGSELAFIAIHPGMLFNVAVDRVIEVCGVQMHSLPGLIII